MAAAPHLVITLSLTDAVAALRMIRRIASSKVTAKRYTPEARLADIETFARQALEACEVRAKKASGDG